MAAWRRLEGVEVTLPIKRPNFINRVANSGKYYGPIADPMSAEVLQSTRMKRPENVRAGFIGFASETVETGKNIDAARSQFFFRCVAWRTGSLRGDARPQMGGVSASLAAR